MSVVCADASLVVKLLLDEEDSEEAGQLWDEWTAQGLEICAPRLLIWECTNSVRRAVIGERITANEGTSVIARLPQLGVVLVDVEDQVLQVWMKFIVGCDLPAAYDATYLGVADMLGCEFWTADQRLYRNVSEILPWVRPFGLGA